MSPNFDRHGDAVCPDCGGVRGNHDPRCKTREPFPTERLSPEAQQEADRIARTAVADGITTILKGLNAALENAHNAGFTFYGTPLWRQSPQGVWQVAFDFSISGPVAK